MNREFIVTVTDYSRGTPGWTVDNLTRSISAQSAAEALLEWGQETGSQVSVYGKDWGKISGDRQVKAVPQ